MIHALTDMQSYTGDSLGDRFGQTEQSQPKQSCVRDPRGDPAIRTIPVLCQRDYIRTDNYKQTPHRVYFSGALQSRNLAFSV